MVMIMKSYVSFCKKFNSCFLAVGIFFLFCAVLLTIVQVILRNVFSFSFTWAEETTRYLVIYAVYMAAGTVFYIDANARVDLLFMLFPDKVKKSLNTVFIILAAAFLVFMGYYGYVYVQRNLTVWCASIHIPWAVPFVSLIIGSVNMLVQVPAKLYLTWNPEKGGTKQ